MEEAFLQVSMAEMKVASSPAVLCCIGLGSCVGVALYDPKVKLGGLAHVMLPDSRISSKKVPMNQPGRYADTAVHALLKEMANQGAKPERIYAKLVGGARMFHLPGKPSEQVALGERILQVVCRELERIGIPISAKDTGGSHGRSLEFRPGDGSLLIRSVHQGVRSL